LGYVRSSNIYVRGYLDLRAWSLRLRAQMRKKHYVKTLSLRKKNNTFPPQDKRNTRDKAKGLLDRFGEVYQGAGRAIPYHFK